MKTLKIHVADIVSFGEKLIVELATVLVFWVRQLLFLVSRVWATVQARAPGTNSYNNDSTTTGI